VKVPGDIDILIAGTSCVDFSGLNNKKKGLGEGGESSDTFYGMMAWIQNHRPLIVIQENVCGADWAGMRLGYMEQGYAAEYSRLDSKLYYIPHTRTRVYLCAVNIKGSDIPNKWVDAMTKMRRKCTATLEDYMLPDDDPRVYKARMELSGDPRRSGPSKARTVEWEKCEGRHQRERIFKKLGLQRPVTAWQEGGVSKALDFMWQDWTRKQVERVLDLMDINFLLSVRDSKYDPMYKAAFWNLSQNVDRNTMGGKPDGISPCLTPHMIPYLCYRGGPMTGIESLHMQGLPIDELLLTKETSQQIQNLAGNAMTSTVVGTSMLCALILALDHLPVRLSEDSMVIDQEEDIESHIIGEEDLEQRPLDLSKTVSLELRDLLNDADRSRRLCVCEGRFAVTENKIRLCKECGFTACDKCGGRPSHVVPENEHTPEFDHRIQPLEFELKLKSILPMKLRLDGINEAALKALKAAEGVPSVKPEDWRVWCELVLKAVKGEFRFKTLVRQETWTVMYDAPDAKLELILNLKKPEWRIFAKCPEMEGVESHRRKLCELPVARMFIQSGKNALSGQWELCLPIFSKFDVLIQGIGQKIPSWQRTLGYTDSATMTSEVYSDLRIQVPDEHKKRFDRDISGDYKLLQTCGTAQGALHIKRDNDGQPPLFFFIDQKRTGDDVDDSFVFSESHRRLAYGDYRSVIAKLIPKWRQSNASDDFSKVQTQVNGHWVAFKALFGPPIDSNSSADGVVLAPGPKGLDFHVSTEDCKSAHTVLECKVPLRDYAEPIWPKGKWVEVDSIHERLTYESLAWLTERVRSMKQLEAWSSLELPVCGLDECQRCAPRPPQLKWFFIKNRYTAIEDPQEAAPYERALKSRPSPFVTQITLDEDNVGVLKIGLNVATLIHRALFRMPADGRGKPMLSWRLVTDYIPEPRLLLPFYELSSNKNDQESAQPPNFRQKLRPEQLRSLTWMKAQEEPDIAPFIEEEVAEALLPHLNWRAEGKAERPNYVRGGVLADEVGYGKTAITIGLIDSTQAKIELPEEMPGAIPVKATLVIVPQHLSRQWASEIVKFTGSKYRVLSIGTQADMNKLTARKIMEADIIIAQAGLFQSDKYLSNLAHFAGAAKPPSGQGRRFFDWQAKALADLAIQVEHLKERGAKGAWARIQEASRRREREEAAETFVPTKRLVGKAYQEEKAAKAAQGSKRRRSSETGDSDAESVDTEESSDRKKKARTTKINQDPWGLQKQLVERDWKNMATPPFEMFYFNRLVVDEFTYYKGQIHAGITSQKSMSRWVLSGTPPLDDFTDVKTIADFLNIHLGIDDDSVGKEGNKKKIRKDMTSKWSPFDPIQCCINVV
jgi:site-specific DNA-cytosine methylase